MPLPTFPSRSPDTNSSELSGRFRLVTPVVQFVVPTAFTATTLRTHTLMAGVVAFGIGSGGPNRQPTAEQVRWLIAVMLVPPGSATDPRVMAPVCGLHAVIEVKVRPLSGIVKGCGVVPAAPAPPV